MGSQLSMGQPFTSSPRVTRSWPSAHTSAKSRQARGSVGSGVGSKGSGWNAFGLNHNDAARARGEAKDEKEKTYCFLDNGIHDAS